MSVAPLPGSPRGSSHRSRAARRPRRRGAHAADRGRSHPPLECAGGERPGGDRDRGGRPARDAGDVTHGGVVDARRPARGTRHADGRCGADRRHGARGDRLPRDQRPPPVRPHRLGRDGRHPRGSPSDHACLDARRRHRRVGGTGLRRPRGGRNERVDRRGAVRRPPRPHAPTARAAHPHGALQHPARRARGWVHSCEPVGVPRFERLVDGPHGRDHPAAHTRPAVVEAGRACAGHDARRSGGRRAGADPPHRRRAGGARTHRARRQRRPHGPRRRLLGIGDGRDHHGGDAHLRPRRPAAGGDLERVVFTLLAAAVTGAAVVLLRVLPPPRRQPRAG